MPGRLDHIRWSGGGTGAGKTTIAHHVAARAGIPVHSTDATIPTHGAKLGPTTAPLLGDLDAAVWLIPTPTFRQAAFATRERSEAFWLRTSDPEHALENVLVRDAIFTSESAAAAARDGLATVAIDGACDADAAAAAIADQLAL